MELRNSVYIVEFYYIGKDFKYFCALNVKTPPLFCHYWIIADNKGAFKWALQILWHTPSSTEYPSHRGHINSMNNYRFLSYNKISTNIPSETQKYDSAMEEAERIALKVWCKQNGAAPRWCWCDTTLNLNVKRWLKAQILSLIFLLFSCIKA